MAGPPTTFEAFSGPMARVYVNGTQLVGWATDIRFSESTHNVPVDVLGSAFTQEYVATAVKVACSVGKIYISDYSLAAEKAFHPGGAGPGASDTDDTASVIKFKELTIEVYDHIADKGRFRLIGCKGSRVEYSISRGGIMAENASYDVRKVERM